MSFSVKCEFNSVGSKMNAKMRRYEAHQAKWKKWLDDFKEQTNLKEYNEVEDGKHGAE